MLYFTGFSPFFVLLFLMVPFFAQGGIIALFTPFMQASLNAIGKNDDAHAEEVDGKSRSFQWLMKAFGILAGGLLATFVGGTIVIGLSTALLTAMLIYVIAKSKTIERAKEVGEKVKSTWKESAKKFAADIKGALKNKGVANIFVPTILLETLMTAVVPIEMQTLLDDKGFSVFAIAAVIFIANIGQGVISNIAYKVFKVKKNSERKISLSQLAEKPKARIALWAAVTASIAAFIMTGSPLFFIAFYALIIIFWTVSTTVESTYNQQNIPEKRISSFYALSVTIDGAISAVFSVAIAKIAGDGNPSSIGYAILWPVVAAAALVIIVAALYRESKKPDAFKKRQNIFHARKILQSA